MGLGAREREKRNADGDGRDSDRNGDEAKAFYTRTMKKTAVRRTTGP